MRLDDQNQVAWSDTIGGDSVDFARNVIATLDGGFSVLGSTQSFSNFTEQYHFKLDSLGALVWQKNWGQVNDQEGFEHVQLPTGEFASFGYVRSNGNGGVEMFLLKSTVDGDFIFGQTQGGPEDDIGYSLVKTAGGYVLCGTTKSYGSGTMDVFLIRAYENGFTASDDVVEYFDPLSTADPISPTSALSLYPNPTTAITHLTTATPLHHAELFDLQGRGVREWSGRVPEELDLRGLPDGVYRFSAIDLEGQRTSLPLMIQSH